MTIGTLSTLIEIARHQPVVGLPPKLSEVSSTLDIPYPPLMRQTDLLSKGVDKTADLGLVQKDFSPDNRRERHVSFTPAGLAFMEELAALLAPSKKPAEEKA